jgi:hypothetical protein
MPSSRTFAIDEPNRRDPHRSLPVPAYKEHKHISGQCRFLFIAFLDMAKFLSIIEAIAGFGWIDLDEGASFLCGAARQAQLSLLGADMPSGIAFDTG